MLDVRRMRILREVADRGSFSAAADALHLTQSAVSQQIAALEKETGTQLLERNHGSVRLTDPGASLVSHASAVITRLEEAERELADIAQLRGGRLRVVSFPTAGATLVADAVPAFRERYPEVELELGEAEPEDSIPRLKAGDYDLALAYDFDSVPFPEDRDTEAHFLLEERLQVALPVGHPLAKRKSLHLDQLSEEEWACGLSPELLPPERDRVVACRRVRARDQLRQRRLPGDPGTGRRGDGGGAAARAPADRPQPRHQGPRRQAAGSGAPGLGDDFEPGAALPATEAMLAVLKDEADCLIRDCRAAA